jgi:hypothetical protein
MQSATLQTIAAPRDNPAYVGEQSREIVGKSLGGKQ